MSAVRKKLVAEVVDGHGVGLYAIPWGLPVVAHVGGEILGGLTAGGGGLVGQVGQLGAVYLVTLTLIFTRGYIQIIRCSKTLCAITEAHDALMNFWILKNMSGILIYLTGIKNKLLLFLHFHIFVYSSVKDI